MKKIISTMPLVLVLIAGCASRDTRTDAPSPPSAPRSTPAPTPASPPAASPPPVSAPTPRAADASEEPIGVEVCDNYLNSYRACHLTVGMVDPSLIDSRRSELHSNWERLARSGDPADRERLESQCSSLKRMMDEALDGRECELPESEFIEANE